MVCDDMRGRVKYFIMQGLIPEAYEGAPHIGGNALTTRQERIKRWKATESRLPREDGIQRVKGHTVSLRAADLSDD